MADDPHAWIRETIENSRALESIGSWEAKRRGRDEGAQEIAESMEAIAAARLERERLDTEDRRRASVDSIFARGAAVVALAALIVAIIALVQ